MDLVSIIGTIASIGSVPLTIYLYIKSKENNIDRIKRDIVKILSYQIGDRRKLTSFEIQTVINSKAREGKINPSKITISLTIEDLVADIISNPLLNKDIKESIIDELRNVYFKGHILTEIDSIEEKTRLKSGKPHTPVNVEKEIKEIINKRDQIENQMISERVTYFKYSQVYGFLVIVMLMVFFIYFIGYNLIDSKSIKLDWPKILGDINISNSLLYGLVASTASAAVVEIYSIFMKKY
jgi:hypothetical protein